MIKKVNDNKTIRDESIKKLLNNLLQADINKLSSLYKTMLTEVLINGKTFGELKEIVQLPTSRQRVVLNNAVNSLSKELLEVNDKLKAHDVLKEELITANRSIEILEKQIKKVASISPKLKNTLALPIDKIGFSARVQKICSDSDINKVSDLVRCSERKFRGLRNCGKTSVEEVQEFLNKNGISWGMDV